LDFERQTSASNLLQQGIQVHRRLLAYVYRLGAQERVSATPAFITQHAQKVPFGIEF
jgi:hypothetical protein